MNIELKVKIPSCAFWYQTLTRLSRAHGLSSYTCCPHPPPLEAGLIVSRWYTERAYARKSPWWWWTEKVKKSRLIVSQLGWNMPTRSSFAPHWIWCYSIAGLPPSIKSAGPGYSPGWSGERHCENLVSCPRTQHNVPGQGSNPDRSIWRWAH